MSDFRINFYSWIFEIIKNLNQSKFDPENLLYYSVLLGLNKLNDGPCEMLKFLKVIMRLSYSEHEKVFIQTM